MKKNVAHLVLAITMLLGIGSANCQASFDGPTMPPPPLPGVAA